MSHKVSLTTSIYPFFCLFLYELNLTSASNSPNKKKCWTCADAAVEKAETAEMAGPSGNLEVPLKKKISLYKLLCEFVGAYKVN